MLAPMIPKLGLGCPFSTARRPRPRLALDAFIRAPFPRAYRYPQAAVWTLPAIGLLLIDMHGCGIICWFWRTGMGYSVSSPVLQLLSCWRTDPTWFFQHWRFMICSKLLTSVILAFNGGRERCSPRLVCRIFKVKSRQQLADMPDSVG